MSTHKIVEGLDKPLLADVICKIKAFEIMDEDNVLYIFDATNLSTLVETCSNIECLSSRVSDYFTSFGSFLGPNSNIVIALYPEGKIACPLYHFCICLGIVVVQFGIYEIGPDRTAAN